MSFLSKPFELEGLVKKHSAKFPETKLRFKHMSFAAIT